jgi:hypothetical protein
VQFSSADDIIKSFEASDERDAVQQDSPSQIVDYTKTPEDVCYEMTKSAIRNLGLEDTTTLDVLSYVYHHGCEPNNASWVIDWLSGHQRFLPLSVFFGSGNFPSRGSQYFRIGSGKASTPRPFLTDH